MIQCTFICKRNDCLACLQNKLKSRKRPQLLQMAANSIVVAQCNANKFSEHYADDACTTLLSGKRK